MYLVLKRILDIVLASIALVVLSPILIPIVIGLKLTGEGYIFYLQKRMGYKNVYFNIYKFATMLKNSPNMGTGTITLRNDPRVSPMGKFLRKTKINELFKNLFLVIICKFDKSNYRIAESQFINKIK